MNTEKGIQDLLFVEFHSYIFIFLSINYIVYYFLDARVSLLLVFNCVY